MLRQGETTHMQFMQMLKTSLKPRRSIIASLVMVSLVASVFILAPTRGASNTLAETCANPPSTPTLNHWPVTYDDVNTPLCHDFPAIDAALDTTNPQFSNSETDWTNGLQMTTGQTGVALMYIHNGAANNLDPEQTTARDVKVITQTDTRVGSSHQIKATFTSSNAATHTKTFTVHTPANAKLEVVPNSGSMYNYEGQVIQNQRNLNLGNSTFDLGDLDACFEYSLFFTFKFKVVTVTPVDETTTLSIDKGVRKMPATADPAPAAYASSVTVNKNDKVEYRIQVTNTGTKVARNVTVTDAGATGITVDPGSTKVETTAGVAVPTAQWSGSIPGTVTLGDLQPGESRIIKYTGVAIECVTAVNTAKAQATNAPQVTDTASVTIQNCVIINPGTPKISIKKSVRNESTSSSASFVDGTVDARTGERVRFQVVVTNTGDTTLNNVRVTDRIPEGLQFDDSVTGDGTPSINGSTFTVDFGSMTAGQSKKVEFAAKVLATGNTTICNIAKATATGVNEVQDDACVKIYTTPKPGTPNIVLSKRAFNDTKNVDATTVQAARGDYITYSLITTNNGTADQTNYIIRDDLSQVLPLADMIAANGGTVSGNVITYPAMTIKAGETVVKTFKVRIKQTLDKNLTYQLKNTYGNTVIITVPGEVVYQAPTTGAAGNSAIAFAGLVTAGFVVMRKRNSLYKLIFA